MAAGARLPTIGACGAIGAPGSFGTETAPHAHVHTAKAIFAIAVVLCGCGGAPAADGMNANGSAPDTDLALALDAGSRGENDGSPATSDGAGGGGGGSGGGCPAASDPVKAVYDAVDAARLAQLLKELSGTRTGHSRWNPGFAQRALPAGVETKVAPIRKTVFLVDRFECERNRISDQERDRRDPRAQPRVGGAGQVARLGGGHRALR